MSTAHFHVLGPLEVVAGGREVELGSPKQRAVLAMLALEPNRAVSVDRIVDQLWGDEPPASALGSLHAYISNLRRLLEPGRPARAPARVLVSRAPGYALVVAADHLDMLAFEKLAAEGAELVASGEPERAAQVLTNSLELWRGPVLADFAFEPFVATASVRLEELRRTAAEDLVDARLAMGQHSTVVSQLEALVQSDPLRERTWCQLIVALYRGGRQADALRAYERARKVLADELGLVPSPQLRDLEQAVLAQDPDLLWSGRVSPSAPARIDIPGPPQPDPDDAALLGRDMELGRVDGLLARLASGRGGVMLVTGEPGVGKTTLLSETARRARDHELHVGWGQAHEGGAAPPLWPWTDALRGLPVPVHHLDALVATDPDPHDPRMAGRVFDQVLSQVRELARQAPVVLVLDDLQWADELSHALVQLALPVTDEVPLLLALGVREPVDDPTADLAATRAALARRRGLERVALSGLDRSAVSALIARVAGEAAAPEVIGAIYDRTAGNPFFVMELVRLLAAEHSLHDPERMVRAGVPVGARDVVRRRLARLPEQAVVVLGVAAVLGPQVDIRLLASITSVGVDELVDLLDLAAVSAVVAESPDEAGLYLFAHDLVREAIYDALPGMRRAGLHQRAVSALLELRGDTLGGAHEVARHALAAIPAAGIDQALPRLMTGVRAAQSQLAFDLAERYLRTGLDLLAGAPATPDRVLAQAEFESRLAQIEFYIHGQRAAAEARIERVRALCATAHPDTRITVLTGHDSLLMLWGDVDGSVAAGDQLIAAGREIGDIQAESDGLYARSLILWAGDVAAARAAIDASVALAQAAAVDGPPPGPHVPLSAKRGMRTVLYTLAGDATAALDEGRAALAAAAGEKSGTWAVSWTGAYVLLAAALAGDAGEVVRLSDDVADRAAGLAYTDAVLEACRAWALALRSPARETSSLRQARGRLAAVGDGLLFVPLALLEASLLVDGGRLDDGRRLLAEARAHADLAGHAAFVPEIERLGARIDRAEGDSTAAADRLAKAIDACQRTGLGLFGARCRKDSADLHPSRRSAADS